MRFIMPAILIGISITLFFMYTDPLYSKIKELKVEDKSYSEALRNSKALEDERDKLTKKSNSIDPADIAKLQKLLPDNIDNIRLILEIEQIASPYGMVLKDIKYNPTAKDTANPTARGIEGGGAPRQTASTDYGVWDLEFSTMGSYNNFLNFTKDLENNLRIVDISSITFSSDTPSGPNSNSSSYKYNFKIKTYWLKN